MDLQKKLEFLPEKVVRFIGAFPEGLRDGDISRSDDVLFSVSVPVGPVPCIPHETLSWAVFHAEYFNGTVCVISDSRGFRLVFDIEGYPGVDAKAEFSDAGHYVERRVRLYRVKNAIGYSSVQMRHGPTGFESFCLDGQAAADLGRMRRDGWVANAGTEGRWERCFVPAAEMSRVLSELGL